MATLREIARVTVNAPGGGEDQTNAWLLWCSVTEEAKRRHCSMTEDGYYVYRGALRTHVRRLWPTLDSDSRNDLEKRAYAYLKIQRLATCVQRKDPPVWHIAATWRTDSPAVVNTYRMTRAERRVTPEEAGEHLEPGEVTTNRQETGQVAKTTEERVAPLRATHEQRREEREARRSLILELLNGLDEPVVAEEVAYAIGVNVSTARGDLNALLEDKRVATRVETPAERTIRYGKTAFARRANLFSTEEPVPARTSRVVIDGFAVESEERSQQTPGHVIDHCLAYRFAKMGSRATFDTITLAEQAGVKPESVRVRIRKLIKMGAITEVKSSGVRAQYRVKDKDAVMKFLGNGTSEEEKPVAKKTVAPPKQVPAPRPGLDLVARAGEILDENERLRVQNTQLKELIDELRREVEELKSRPSVDDATLARLQGWQPSA